jgi:chorismate synthase
MTWGNRLRLSIFGESHGPAIGAVLEGLPAGEEINMEQVLVQMARRAPGHDLSATPRKESDTPQILSGMLNGKTTGSPLCAVIANTNTHSSDYDSFRTVPRPGHADYTAYLRYRGFSDARGGGHFSGRLTAPLVFMGAVCRQILKRRGVTVGSHVLSVHGAADTPFDPVNVSAGLLEDLSSRYFPTVDPLAESAMRAEIESARKALDSVGGVVECAAVGQSGGFGGPLSEGVESLLSSLLFAIPACKGVEFGTGFLAAELFGSENNDPFFYDGEAVKTRTNNAGGILGGITTGMPLIFRAAFKPTPSIGQEQESVDLAAKKDVKLAGHGRHDPCIAPRAAVAVEAAAAVALLDLML